MIKENELRIGNMLHFYKPLETEIKTLTVTGIFEEDGIYYVSSKEYTPINLEGVKPISLTPEILERCGFERDSIKKFTHFNFKEDSGYCRYKVVFKKHRDVLFRINSTGAWLSLANLKHLHQLQNIYFALTGEDLEFKEPVKQ